VFTCLLGLMMWVPFNPWSFDPAQAFETANAAGQSMMKGASGAMGQAAQAGGMPAGQVQAMQGQINQALQPMEQISQSMALASNGPTGTASGMYQGTGAIAGASNQGSQGTGNTGTASANVTPPPSANFANASPTTSSPIPTSNESSTSQPPTSNNEQGNTANLALAQNAVPTMPVSTMQESTSLTPTNEASLAVNGNASTNDVAAALPEAQVQMASLGVNGGEGSPPTADNGFTGGGNEGGGNANMVAMSEPTTSGGQGESQGQGSNNTSGGGGSGDSTIQVASLAAASSTGSQQSGGNNNPPNQGSTDNKGNNDQTPPPTAYA